jgi:hypothetical protein
MSGSPLSDIPPSGSPSGRREAASVGGFVVNNSAATAPNFPQRGLVRVGSCVKAVVNVFPAAAG